MFFTPGWGAKLTVTGTLGGVAITQAANSAVSWRTSRKDRNKLITESVAELIATGNSWVYATSTQEQDVFHAVATKADEETMMAKLVELRANLYEAQISYGRALAVVRLTCPSKVLQAAEAYGDALLEYEAERGAKVPYCWTREAWAASKRRHPSLWSPGWLSSLT